MKASEKKSSTQKSDKPLFRYISLVTAATTFLISKLGYSSSTTDKYHAVWMDVGKFMIRNNIEDYSPSVAEKYLRDRYKGIKIADIPAHERMYVNGVNGLSEFLETNKISFPIHEPKKKFVFPGPVGNAIKEFLRYKSEEVKLSPRSIRRYSYDLEIFANYCVQVVVRSVKELNQKFFLDFFDTYKPTKGTGMEMMLCSLRGLTTYLFEKGMLEKNPANRFPRARRLEPDLPSVYSPEEVNKLLESIDRSNATGKRNYAFMLLIVKTGLRASDVANLKFENLHWEVDLIRLFQVKSNEEAIYPITPDVGNAIVNYLDSSRPKSNEPFVFLSQRPPYGPFPNSNIITHVFQRAFAKSGIDVSDRKHGPHSLRSTAITRMIEGDTPLPVIIGMAGYKRPNNLKHYARYSRVVLEKCMLDVPLVPNEFYENLR